MIVVVFSKDNRSVAAVREAVGSHGRGAQVEAFDNDRELMEHVLNLDDAPPPMVFVDLTSGAHGVRLFKWLKLAPGTQDLKVVGFGENDRSVQRLIESWGSDAVRGTPLSVDAVRSILLSEDSKAVVSDAINLCPPGVLYLADNPADRHLFSAAIAQSTATFSIQLLQNSADLIDYLRAKAESRRITSSSSFCLLLDTASVGEPTHNILRWIRDQSGFPDLCLVVLSAIDDSESVRATYDAGADYYLLKPKSFEGLSAIIQVIEAGLRQTVPQLHNFTRLAEYRDPRGMAVTAIPAIIGARYAQ